MASTYDSHLNNASISKPEHGDYEILNLSITELGSRYRERKLSPVDVTQACLNWIGQHDSKFNACLTIVGDLAMSDAKRAADESARGIDRGSFHGVPYAHVTAAGIATTSHSKLYSDHVLGRYAHVAGIPALVAPSGFSTMGLPLSFQLAGRTFDEATVLQAGAAYQSATDWHTRRPSL